MGDSILRIINLSVFYRSTISDEHADRIDDSIDRPQTLPPPWSSTPQTCLPPPHHHTRATPHQNPPPPQAHPSPAPTRPLHLLNTLILPPLLLLEPRPPLSKPRSPPRSPTILPSNP